VPVIVNFAADVGPEFFGQVADGVEEDVGAPDVHGVAEGALVVGVIGVGDAGGDGGAYDFGVIELEGATVGAGDEDAADGILHAVPLAAYAELEIAGVLMEESGEDGGGHHRANASVSKGGGVALAVTLEALAVGGLTVLGLAHQRDHTEERNRNRVGHGFVGELELGSCGERAELIVLFDGRVVGEDEE